MPAAGGLMMAVREGRCLLRVWEEGGRGGDLPVEARDEMELSAGDVVMLLPPRSHELRDSASTPVQDFWQQVELPLPPPGMNGGPMGKGWGGNGGVIKPGMPFPAPPQPKLGGDGAATVLLVAVMFFDRGGDQRLLSALPPVLRVKAGGGLGGVFHALEGEIASGGPGTLAMMSRLMQAVFDEAVRGYVTSLMLADGSGASENGRSRGWIEALLDEGIGPALALIHNFPERMWSVQGLAEEVAMSRSTFSERFGALVGEPPMQYLLNYRMKRAEMLLREGKLPVKEVAARVGYGSLAAFSSAYKRERGVSPGRVKE